MTDEEKIEQAAKTEQFKMRKAATADYKQLFKDAVKWRDENPSPEVLALVAALKMWRKSFYCDGETEEKAQAKELAFNEFVEMQERALAERKKK